MPEDNTGIYPITTTSGADVDNEMWAIKSAWAALSPLREDARNRALAWLMDWVVSERSEDSLDF